ncbi:MAG TPA: addiction module protein [Thermodesulfovibrionia bacterium]|nr:addiction module protein [Thermodesulfovibrionia bacterium]
MSIADIKKCIAQLSTNERATLACWIIANLDGSDEKEVDSAWRQEIRSRVDEIKSGKVKMISSTELWKDLLRYYVTTS